MRLRRPLLAGCLVVLFMIWSMVMIFNPPPWDSELSHLEGEIIEVTGRVYRKECKEKYNEQVMVFYLKACDVKGPNQDEIQCNNLICEVPGVVDVDIRYGSVLRVSGTFSSYLHATNPGEFDAAEYYAGMEIAGCLTEGKVIALGKDYSMMQDALRRFGDYLEKSLLESLGGEEAQIMAKMLLGRGEELAEATKTLYQEGGIYHILSISGMHISLLGMGIYRFLRKRSVPLSAAAFIGSVFILLYGIMIGFGISAIRAIGMYLVHLLGDVVGRSYDMPTAMGVMAVGMALHNPKVLFSAGYLLSFACVFCLGFFTPAMVRLMCKDGKKHKVWNGFVTSLSINIFTLPLQLYFFYQVPIYSVFLNLLVVPFVEALMLMGILLLIFPFMVPLEWGIRGILRLYEWLCVLFSKLPCSVYIAGRPKEWTIVAFYVCIMVFIACAGRKFKGVKPVLWRRRLGWIVLVIGIFLVCVPGRLQTRITFFDVGQGDCTLVQTWNGKNYLIDAGSSSKSSVGKYQIVPALKYLGVNYLDAIIITHPDYDHYSALGDVLEAYGDRCGGVVLPAIEKEKRACEFAEVYEEIRLVFCGEKCEEKSGLGATYLPIYFMGAGDVLYEDKGVPILCNIFSWAQGLRLFCLAPAPEASYSGSNEYSIVLAMEYGEFSALFTGDVEGYGEEVLCDVLENREKLWDGAELNRQPLRQRLTVLKVAHHGSSGSTSEEFLRLVRPRVAIISCGRNNSYGHPHKETLERLAAVDASILTTPDNGAITIEIVPGSRYNRARRNTSTGGRVTIHRWGVP